MAKSVIRENSSIPLPARLLWQRDWPAAAQLFWSRIGQLDHICRDQVAADFWSGSKERCKSACEALANALFAGGHHDEALGALMLAVDLADGQSLKHVLPHLSYAVEHRWNWSTDDAARDEALQRLAVWRRADDGDFEDDGHSIFSITCREMLGQDTVHNDPSNASFGNVNTPSYGSVVPRIVVMRRDKAIALSKQNSAFKDLIGANLRLVVARDVVAVRTALLDEYPHAAGAIDLVLRDLKQDEPVRLKPVLLTGPAGVGKSRLVRRLGELLGIGVYRYDGAAASDNMFGGSPKAWGNTTPSAPTRAIHQTRLANPILMVDEIEKAATSCTNGRLWDALLPFLERETAARYRDISLDAELNLSFISYLATANSSEGLPPPLKDRFRIIKIPTPSLRDLPRLASRVLQEIALDTGEQEFIWPLAVDELEIISQVWKKSGFSIRKLRSILEATIEARSVSALRH